MYTTKRINSLEIQPFLVGFKKKQKKPRYVKSKHTYVCLKQTYLGMLNANSLLKHT